MTKYKPQRLQRRRDSIKEVNKTKDTPSTASTASTLRTARTPPHIAANSPVLLVKEPWISKLIGGKKVLEIRTSSTRKHPPGTRVYLAQGKGDAGSEHPIVRGHASFVQAFEITSEKQWDELTPRHCVVSEKDKFEYFTKQQQRKRKTWAWEFKDPVPYEQPVPFRGKAGTVVWAKFDPIE